MKNFITEYNALVANIINEIVTLLDNKGLTELTIFEGDAYDKNNYDIPVYKTFHIDGDIFYQFIKKLVKIDNKWGFILYDEDEKTTQFPKELTYQNMKFECAECLYRRIYGPLNSKKVRTPKVKDSGTLAKLKAKLEQQ